MTEETPKIPDVEFANVGTAIQDAVRCAKAAQAPPEPGRRNNAAEDWKAAEKRLEECMKALSVSPHVQIPQRPHGLNRKTVLAIRHASALTKRMLNDPEFRNAEGTEDLLDTAIINTVNALCPDNPLSEEDIEEIKNQGKVEGKGKGKGKDTKLITINLANILRISYQPGNPEVRPSGFIESETLQRGRG